MIKLLFTANHSPFSYAIRVATWSPYSHVDVVLDHDLVVGATVRHGVSLRHIDDVLEASSKHLFVELDAPESVKCRVLSQLGKPYDLPGLFGFLTKRDWQIEDRWFCSELVAWALEREGVRLFNEKHWRVTPRDLLIAPACRWLPDGKA